MPAFVLMILALFGMPASILSHVGIDSGRDQDHRETSVVVDPAYAVVGHRIGAMELGITNHGIFGTGFAQASVIDFFTGDIVSSCEYPKGSNIRYLFSGAFWIGAIVGRDTLVSTGAGGDEWSREFHPDRFGLGDPVYRSIIDPESQDFQDAISEEDYIVVYTDTLLSGVDRDYFGRPHRPLNIEVTEASYAWSYDYAEDLVLFDYRVRNIGNDVLEDVYMGIYVDADIGMSGGSDVIYEDDFTGFVHTFSALCGDCPYEDTVNIAWTADNDGDLEAMPPDGAPAPGITATRIVRTPAAELDVSFNWWIRDSDPARNFGPREKANVGRWKEPFRDFGFGGLGTPLGDANKYYMMRNQEFDYDQPFTATTRLTDTLWMLPDQRYAPIWSVGLDTRYLLSFGPFVIRPNEVLPISFAYVAGDGFHTDPDNLQNLPDNPDDFYANLNFDDLGKNARWASWIYDNPGVDSDDDGFAGQTIICVDQEDPSVADTCWLGGDGVPDFRGASPPPAPDFWIEPEVGSLRIRFNGARSETTLDVFSREMDFEGYRIYIGRDSRKSSFSVLVSYDLEDYNKYGRVGSGGVYQLLDTPFPLDELRCLYGDSCGDQIFHPLQYDDPGHPLMVGDSAFYFEKQDHNSSVLGVSTGIRKLFPDEPYPSSTDPNSALPSELTEDGYLKYFEYEYVISGLLPTVEYWVSVTAFDFGSPSSGLTSLETVATLGAKPAYAMASGGDVVNQGLEAYIYPNPYRLDANYRESGLEGRLRGDYNEDRLREVHFANLPPKCTISVFSLDGDLVREIIHDVPADNPVASHDSWDLITRNTQLAVSGLYYWTVESPDGKVQIGKLVLIM